MFLYYVPALTSQTRQPVLIDTIRLGSDCCIKMYGLTLQKCKKNGDKVSIIELLELFITFHCHGSRTRCIVVGWGGVDHGQGDHRW